MTTEDQNNPRAAAIHIGERLVLSAVRDGGMCTWMGDDLEGTAEAPVLVHRAFGGALYDGTAGIGRFLTDLWSVTGDERFPELAAEAFRHSLFHASAEQCGDGLFDGRLGMALTALSCSKRLGQPDLADAATALAENVVGRCEFGDRHDYVGGMAGGIVGLVALEGLLGAGSALDAARGVAARLIEGAIRSSSGMSWEAEDDRQWGQHIPVNGLAHGVSGVVHAMLELDRIDPGGGHGNDSWVDVAGEGLRWERQWFARDRNGWLDLRLCDRQSVSAAPVTDHWCQGTVGTGLVRLRASELLQQDRLFAEAGAALQRCVVVAERLTQIPPDRVHPFKSNASLCHGWSGLCELLCEGARVLDNDELLVTARRLGSHGAAVAEAHGGRWPCGLQTAGETPGLLLGLAGIGTIYLRLMGDCGVPPVGLPTLP